MSSRPEEIIDVDIERRSFPVGSFVAVLDFDVDQKRHMLEHYGCTVHGECGYEDMSDADIDEWAAVIIRIDDDSRNAYWQVDGYCVMVSNDEIIETRELLVLNAWDAIDVFPIEDDEQVLQLHQQRRLQG